MSTKLDLTKPVQTRDGRKARILCTDLLHPHFKIVAAVTRPNDAETVLLMSAEGTNSLGTESPNDLFNVPEPRKFDWNKPMMTQDGHAVFENEVISRSFRHVRLFFNGGVVWLLYTETGLCVGLEDNKNCPHHLVNV